MSSGRRQPVSLRPPCSTDSRPSGRARPSRRSSTCSSSSGSAPTSSRSSARSGSRPARWSASRRAGSGRASSCMTAFVFSDLIDGAMARKIGRTDTFGAFLDSTLDRIADAALFGGMALFFAWQTERPPLPGARAGLPGHGLGDVVRAEQGRAARLQRQDRSRRAPRPAGGAPDPDVLRRPLRPADPLRGRAVADRGAEHDHGDPADPARTPPGARRGTESAGAPGPAAA